MDKFAALFARGGLSLDRLRTLCRVAVAGSLTAAAESDASLVSLFSRQLKELEGYFGTRLVRRQGHRLALTEDGAVLAEIASRQFIELAEFARHCRGAVAEISLGGGASVMEWLLMPLLPALRNAVRKSRFRLVREGSGTLARRLASLQLDVAIVREETLLPPLQSVPLAVFGYTLFVPRPLAGPARTVRQWLPKIPMIAPAAGWTRDQLDSAAAAAGIRLRIHVEASSATLAVRALRDGSYAAILPQLAAQELEGADVIALRPKFLRSIERRLCIAWNPRMAEARPVVRQAVEAIRAAAGGMPQRPG